MQVTVGRTVLYKLSEDDAKQINRRRTTSGEIRERIEQTFAPSTPPSRPVWPLGAQAHIGNTAGEGDVVPMVVVRVWPNEYGEGVPGVNGQAFLDGNDALWITSAKEGADPGTWAWPPRV